MAITVTTIAATTQLTTLARFRRAFAGQLNTQDDAAVVELIRTQSAAIANYCGVAFGRQAYTETAAGFGGLRLSLAARPTVYVSAIIDRNSGVVTNYSIDSKDGGMLYRELGWAWSAQMFPGLTGSYKLFDQGTPMPNQEDRAYTIDYVAGYVLPPQYLDSVSGLSILASDNSFNDASGRFPALLRAGDVIESAGFTTQDARYRAIGTPTASKIVVDATLVDDSAAGARSLTFLPPAECRAFDDVEQAIFEAVKVALLDAGRDTRVTLRRTSQTEIEYSGSDDELSAQYGLPARCIGLLRPWVSRRR